MKCPACGKSLWFAKSRCPFCQAELPALERPARPWSVSIPSLFFLIIGVITLVLLGLQFIKPEHTARLQEFRLRDPFHFYMLVLMPALLVAASLLMLRGSNLARWVFVIFVGNNVFWQTIKFPTTAWPGATLFVLLVVMLFLPQSNTFFGGIFPGDKPKAKPS